MASRPLKIAFVGRYYWHNGSSHALLGYYRAGLHLGHDVRVSAIGIIDEVVRDKVPVASKDWRPDLMVLVFEERFLRGEGFACVEKVVPRERRLVIDPDGKYSDAVRAGTDSNHDTPDSQTLWSGDFDRLSDIVLQPTLGVPGNGARRFLYFGVDRHRQQDPGARNEKPYDIVYVGNNWYRWTDVAWLIRSLAPVRSRIGRIGIFGRYWSGDPLPGYEEHTRSDRAFLDEHGVEVHRSVPFDGVEAAMGAGRLCPILVRPVLAALQLVTPRMFETFAAATVPLLPPHLQYTKALFGGGADGHFLTEQPVERVLAALDDYERHVRSAQDIRAELALHHSYEQRLAQLLSFVS